MWLNGIEYQLVEKGTIENTFLFGLMMGFLLIGAVMYLYMIAKRTVFRKYYQQIKDLSFRLDLMSRIKHMAEDADALADKTNTHFFKSLANDFNSLIAELKRRQ